MLHTITRAIPMPTKQAVLHMKIDPVLKKSLEAKAASENRSLSNMVETALKGFVSEFTAKAKK